MASRQARWEAKKRAERGPVPIGRPRVEVKARSVPGYWRFRRYGITEEQYQAMLAAQDNGCAICHTPFVEGVKVCVDHCHDEGHVRGLLCNDCNMALGRFKDDPDNLRRALAYLMQPVAKSSP